MDCGGETIRFAGRIDRIDVGRVAGEAVFSIVDYKSGRPRKETSLKAVLAGQSLQPWLYALAAERLLAGERAVAFRAAYWHVAGPGYQEKEALQFRVIAEGEIAVSEQWQAIEDELKGRVRSLVEGIRHGEFPMHSADEDCTGRCEYSTVCRVNQARSIGKQWKPPGEQSP